MEAPAHGRDAVIRPLASADPSQGAAPLARVLIVDDEEPIRRLLSRLLTRAGYECVTASSARAGREELATSHFDLLLSDLVMPEESGFTLLSYASDHCPHLAVLVVSSMYAPEVAEPNATRGVDGYILKPFDTATVLARIADVLADRARAGSTGTELARVEAGTATENAELHVALRSRSAEPTAVLRHDNS